jgi:ribosome-associated protein
MARLAHRIDGQGNLRIIASESRSQRQNRDAAAERLGALVARALLVPKRRRPTRPTAASKRQRIDAKRRLSEKKRLRRGTERD